MPKILINLDHVTKSFQEAGQERLVLRDINAQIQQGEVIALLGRSGSGKSTLLNILSGIDAPSSGNITINAIDLGKLNEHQRTLFRRQHIGFVFQFFNLIPTLSVEENVLLPLELAGRLTAAQRERAYELLRRVHLFDRRHVYPDKLSGGEQQRIAIARALAHDPLLILADEPTGNLDATTGEEVLNLLDEMSRQAGKTLLMVTHSLEVARRADRVLSKVDGQLVEHSLAEVAL
ncbi:ABC transporter ATP-binding protein [Herpetosiphon giganteus]|uniref:ABC transporter ATP-binding protein n=1 Tax=Herpetosiphon giganteus TaxID=2029754 RepID=UPI001958EF55|nr:ABC transporter ATP-binding protein [Herpetosiphon giganteus]MBM7844424.1 putative ABC transport system ATP-binding protein [Herpetosiphon giganteus]